MRPLFLFLVAVAVLLTGCRKEDKPVYSGIMTINNKRAGVSPTYYIEGFHVPTGKKVPDLNNKLDIISVLSDYDVNFNPLKIIFITNNFKNSFYRYGQYSDTKSAEDAFNALTEFTEPVWTEIGDSVRINQIWIYRTSDSRYAKLRIISTILEKRPDMQDPYAECTFEWVFQPDGTKTFPPR
ncbi:MAG TPA: hypothetical protein P5320_03010 [Bacteroidales bacterium]|nr:hypothetical protein [Bacteroidales bacterium]HOK74025.1 hypothetical protein [Bacteroidales bacterium]HOM40817.1 hypothetical protein [Bacteroidales bacterium]HOU29732.1 hypothetical protein [Bacteroidales bacterium]HPP92519.1 hypothetical protein [Bacteroidales bacterium]